MSNLEKLKQKLMVKPIFQEREVVVVAIKGNKNNQNKQTNQNNKTQLSTTITKVEEKEHIEPDSTNVNNEGEIETQPSNTSQVIPLIVDKTHIGFDRNTLLEKLAQSKLSKVKVKSTIQTQPQIQTPTTQITQPIETITKPKKIKKLSMFTIQEDENENDNKNQQEEEKENVNLEQIEPQEDVIIIPKKRTRITKKVEKGIAIIGPETKSIIGDTALVDRLPKKTTPIIIKAPKYYMNNREKFVSFINSLFEPYKQEMLHHKEEISCDNIGNASGDFSLLTHQKIVRDYMNLYTPYRGILLFHGLGSGKTASSIAIAEGMKDAKRIIVMTPASLRANYIEELKKAGDLFYKKNQFWEWVSTDKNPDVAQTISAVLNLPLEYIRKQHGAWFINVKKEPNYDNLTDVDKQSLDKQLDEMIRSKYTFINYNGLRSTKLKELTSGYTRNLFDNSVVIIDEAHNLISRIVNKLTKEKDIKEDERGEKEHLPTNLSTKLYEYLLSATNARIVLLTGTPVINYPNEFGILFNILRGYIKTWKIPLNITTANKIDKDVLTKMLLSEKSHDYLDYSPSSKILTITRNPFGFRNIIKTTGEYEGVSNSKKDENGNYTFQTDFVSDTEFETKIINILRRNNIEVVSNGVKISNQKALPDKIEHFYNRFIEEGTGKLKNVDVLKRRIIGLSSYFRSAQENLLPKYKKILGEDYHIVRIPMSDFQFKIYEAARVEERKTEKPKKKNNPGDDMKEQTSTYRIFSRLFCNYVMPDRPMPKNFRLAPENANDAAAATKKVSVLKENENEGGLDNLLSQARKEETKQDLSDEQEAEIEGDEILNKLGGETYTNKLDETLRFLQENSNDFLTPEALQTYSPKFLHMLDNIQDPEYKGLHLVYSQFRTLEGIGIFSLVLEKNGFTRFTVKKNDAGVWKIDIPDEKLGQPTYALYTGTETTEEKEMLRHIYNGEWDLVPDTISGVLRKMANNNNMGEIIKVFMITSSGSEGINLRNTRYVHIMEPYWHPVRTEQVIGRARRICSHKNLPEELQTVEVFIYLMIFTEEQLKSDEAKELKKKDLSKNKPHVPLTSDQNLFEISEIKAGLTSQLTDAVKETAFDCYIYTKDGKCVNFGNPANDKFSYVPDYSDQQNDTTTKANKTAVQWTGKPITIMGTEYISRRINPQLLYIYDKTSYEQALKDSSVIPLQIGTLELNEKGQEVFKMVN
jgi:hypothetical protein